MSAAGVVHSDIARGFIRAEVNTYDELAAVNGSFADLRARGQLRLEGRDYLVSDGEICHFRFNVRYGTLIREAKGIATVRLPNGAVRRAEPVYGLNWKGCTARPSWFAGWKGSLPATVTPV